MYAPFDDQREPNSRWQHEGRGVFTFVFEFGKIWLDPRPSHCNRGDYLAHLDGGVDPNHGGFHVSEKDFWPRYLFGEKQAKLHAEEWLSRHGINLETGKFEREKVE